MCLQDLSFLLRMLRTFRRQTKVLGDYITARNFVIALCVIGVYLFFYYFWMYFVGYSRPYLMEHDARVCNRCNGSHIPKILHHTWVDYDIPSKWDTTYQSCLAKHSDYEHKLWSHDDMDNFIEKEYAWFFPIYKNYPYQIQRAASFRYFAMYHYGGVYIDLDIGCHNSVSDILRNLSGYRVLLAETKPTGITNAFQASVPKHPLYSLAISRLKCTSWWHVIPYIHVMFGTGPMFFTGTAQMNPSKDDTYVIPYYDFRVKNFWLIKGQSWQIQWDSWFWLMLNNIPYGFWNVFTFILFMMIVMLSIGCCCLPNPYRDRFRDMVDVRKIAPRFR